METMAENSNPTLPMVLDHLLNPSKETIALVGKDGGPRSVTRCGARSRVTWRECSMLRPPWPSTPTRR